MRQTKKLLGSFILVFLVIFTLNGCLGAMGSSLMLRPKKNFSSRGEVIDASKKIIFDLYIEEVSRFLPRKIKDDDWRIVGVAVNLFVPLPPARIKNLVAFKIQNGGANDIIKISKILEKNGWWLVRTNISDDNEKYFYAKDNDEDITIDKNLIVISSFDAFELLQILRKDMQLEFSPESEKIYQEAKKS